MASKSSEWASERVRRKPPAQGAFDFMVEGRSPSEPFPVNEIDGECLAAAVTRWCSQGYAIMFGCSGDGGAFGIHLHAGGEKRVHWATTAQDAEDFLSGVPGLKQAK